MLRVEIMTTILLPRVLRRHHRGKVKSVHESKADFKIEFEDGSSATFCLADPGSSVAGRDKNNAIEYLG